MFLNEMPGGPLLTAGIFLTSVLTASNWRYSVARALFALCLGTFTSILIFNGLIFTQIASKQCVGMSELVAPRFFDVWLLIPIVPALLLVLLDLSTKRRRGHSHAGEPMCGPAGIE